MAGIEPQPAAARLLGGGGVGRDRPRGIGGVSARIGFGVELHAVGAARGGAPHHLGHGVDEDRNADSETLEPFADRCRNPRCATVFQPAFDVTASAASGTSVTCVGRTSSTSATKLSIGLPSMLNSVASTRVSVPHVVVADVARVGPRMHRDAVRAEAFDVERRADHVGQIAAARIAHYGDLIDVHAQLCHNNAIFAAVNSARTGRPTERPRPEFRSGASVSAW